MNLSKMQVYDAPTIICACGACEPNPELERFTDDLDWLKQQGVEVERFNPSLHPAEFDQQENVRDAVKAEGAKCLPLIVVNNSIVSRGVYPSRSELMQFVGFVGEPIEEQLTSAEGSESPGLPMKEAVVCGPGCNCEKPPKRNWMKVAISLIVLLAAGSILAYKALDTKQDASSAADNKDVAAYNVAPTAPKTTETQPADVEEPQGSEESPARITQPKGDGPSSSDSPKAGRRIGENLESLKALDKVAMGQDAVFIYIPRKGSEIANGNTIEAVLGAQKTLKSNNIKLGLYTLPTSSPDYASLSAQVKPPAILVASKGKGMTAVSGLITEAKLLQAFVSCSSAGGCGSSSGGCGPSTPGCK